MIIDVRYHIASLVAVFLALGLGILIGMSMAGNDALTKQQSAMIDQLAATFDSLKAERHELEAQLSLQEARIKADDQFARKAMPLLIRDRLFGKQIALIRTTESLGQKSTDELVAALELAGANVTSVTTLTPDLGGVGASSAGAGGSAAAGTGGDDGGSIPLGKYLGALAVSVAQGISDPTADYLRSRELVRVRGAYGVPADIVIVIGGGVEENATSWNTVDAPLIKSLRSLGAPVAAVEPLSGVKSSYIKYYRSEAALTVDNVDTAAGQIALILALAEGKQGHFGMKEAGKPVLPDLTGGTQ